MQNIEQLAQLGGTVATVVVFIWYLIQRDKMFDKIINKNNEINTKIAVTLKELCNLVKNVKGETGKTGLRGERGLRGFRGEN